MCRGIDNRDCYWINQFTIERGFVSDTYYGCSFNPDDAGAPCKFNQLCERYVAKDKLDDYIRMLLAELGETNG